MSVMCQDIFNLFIGPFTDKQTVIESLSKCDFYYVKTHYCHFGEFSLQSPVVH